MRILITGGMGFIGSHLADAYLKKGDTVYVIDNLTTGSLSNIKHLRQNPLYDDRFFTIVEDILNYEKMEDLISRVDMVIHLAAAVGVQYIIDNPISSIITNVRGTEIVLEIANKYQKKVLITSTSEVYGKHTHAPLRETDDCVYGPSSRFRCFPWIRVNRAAEAESAFDRLAEESRGKYPFTIMQMKKAG